MAKFDMSKTSFNVLPSSRRMGFFKAFMRESDGSIPLFYRSPAGLELVGWMQTDGSSPVITSESLRPVDSPNHSGITRQMLSDTRQRPDSGLGYHSGFREEQAVPEASK